MARLRLPLADDVPLYEGNLDADLPVVARNRLAEQITGGLSLTSKMPCPSWGISASRCRIGAVLATQENTTCAHCYARSGRYRFPNVQRKLEERYRGLFHPLWTPAMTFLIRWYAERYFRWFDAGDLQGASHLHNICTVAAHTPEIRHWLPTREIETVRSVLRERGAFPANLVVRVSAPLIDGKPPKGLPYTSSVVTDGESCPAHRQEGVCGACRACWDPQIPHVAYRLT